MVLPVTALQAYKTIFSRQIAANVPKSGNAEADKERRRISTHTQPPLKLRLFLQLRFVLDAIITFQLTDQLAAL